MGTYMECSEDPVQALRTMSFVLPFLTDVAEERLGFGPVVRVVEDAVLDGAERRGWWLKSIGR